MIPGSVTEPVASVVKAFHYIVGRIPTRILRDRLVVAYRAARHVKPASGTGAAGLNIAALRFEGVCRQGVVVNDVLKSLRCCGLLCCILLLA